MVEPGEMVLSDVHVRSRFAAVGEKQSTLTSSRFPFRVRETNASANRGPDSVIDSDVVVIQHSLQTTLKEVGLQVWNGCLLLADFFLAHPHLGDGDVWLELGAGTGLCSIVAALSRDAASCPKEIICTDIGDKVIDLCRRNIRENIALVNDRFVSTDLRVTEVDFLTYGDDDRRVDVYSSAGDKLEKGILLLPLLQKASTIFAADIIFDADVTEGFFDLVVNVMTRVNDGEAPASRKKKTLYLALEKRILFSVFDTDEPSSPIYDHFRACLEGLLDMRFENGRFAAEKLDMGFPQAFHKSYERNDYLELWCLTFSYC